MKFHKSAALTNLTSKNNPLLLNNFCLKLFLGANSSHILSPSYPKAAGKVVTLLQGRELLPVKHCSQFYTNRYFPFP